MSRSRSLRALGLLLLAGGCAHSVHQYQVSDAGTANLQRAAKAQAITADGEQFVILGFTANTDYVEEAFERLRVQCPDGEIARIHTRYSTSLKFLSYTNKVHLQANCYRSTIL
jgi:hypothetical protein